MKKTMNFSEVSWNDEPTLPVDSRKCDTISICYSVDDGYICDTKVIAIAVYSNIEEISSLTGSTDYSSIQDKPQNTLRISTFAPDMLDDGEIISLGNYNINDVDFYFRISTDSCFNLGKDTFFGFLDNHGVKRYLKNILFTVNIDRVGSFRNAVHFINMADQDRCDMYYETDVIEDFFYHPSHASFLSIRIIQRF